MTVKITRYKMSPRPRCWGCGRFASWEPGPCKACGHFNDPADLPSRQVMIQEFWSRVDIQGPSDCWEWLASRGFDKYGQYKAFGSKERAHRRAYEYTFGSIPDKLHILHSCDNPPCCNPGHLFAGTHQDNMDDMIKKGRQKALSEDERIKQETAKKESAERMQLAKIKALKAQWMLERGYLQSEISRILDIDFTYVSHISSKRRFCDIHITDPALYIDWHKFRADFIGPLPSPPVLHRIAKIKDRAGRAGLRFNLELFSKIKTNFGTQKAFALESKISGGLISEIINGRRVPSDKEEWKIANALDCAVIEIFEVEP